MVCSPKVLKAISDDSAEMFERAPMQKLTAANEVNVFKHEGFWQPMDTLSEMQYLNQLWDSGNAPWKIW